MKEKTYEKEDLFLSPYAQKSMKSRGRAREEAPCPMRTDFQRDRDRIIYSKAFLRLKNKTQVFYAPDGDHYMSRLTKTLQRPLRSGTTSGTRPSGMWGSAF